METLEKAMSQAEGRLTIQERTFDFAVRILNLEALGMESYFLLHTSYL